VAFESDLGSRTPVAWGFSGQPNAVEYFQNIVSTYFEPIYNITNVQLDDGESVDSGYIGASGAPLIRNVGEDTNDEYYFTFHHSGGDSMTMLDPT